MAQYHLGRCLLEAGNRDAGIRSLEKTIDLVKDMEETRQIDSAGDLTVAALRDYAGMHLSIARKSGSGKGRK
jgi:hypothetical protein